jgi:hypothetical protein
MLPGRYKVTKYQIYLVLSRNYVGQYTLFQLLHLNLFLLHYAIHFTRSRRWNVVHFRFKQFCAHFIVNERVTRNINSKYSGFCHLLCECYYHHLAQIVIQSASYNRK